MSPTLLLIDDERAIRDSVKRILRKSKLNIVEAANGVEALDLIREQPVDVILLDLRMPIMDGYGFLERFRKEAVNQVVPICVMTGSSEDRERQKAIDLGADDFIEKPAHSVELKTRIKSLLRIHNFQAQLSGMNVQLEEKVKERTAELCTTIEQLAATQKEIELSYQETVVRLTMAAESKDKCTAAHLQRIGHYSALLARKCNWAESDIPLLVEASKMHDIGKLGVPDSILNKPAKLTKEEFDVMKQHTVMGARILEGSPSKLLQIGSIIALSHHERYDGTGYPKGLTGKAIPEEGRIVAIADVFDALMTKRSYKEAWTLEDTVANMRSETGTHFDPKLLELFLEDTSELMEIHNRYEVATDDSRMASFVTPAKEVKPDKRDVNTPPEPAAEPIELKPDEKPTKIDELSSMIGHEMRNPAACLDNNLEVLNEYFQELLDQYASKLYQAGNGQEAVPNEKSSALDLIYSDIPNLLKDSKNSLRQILRVIEDLSDLSRRETRASSDLWDRR